MVVTNITGPIGVETTLKNDGEKNNSEETRLNAIK